MADVKKQNNRKELNMDTMVRNLNKSVYGTSNSINDELEADNKKFLDTVGMLLKDTQEQIGGDLLGNLGGYFEKNGTQQDVLNFNNIKDMMDGEDGMSSGLLSYAYMSYDSRIQYYKDLKLVTTLIPQLQDAVDTMTDNIMSSDNYNNLLTLILPDKEQDTYEEIEEKYDFTNNLRICVNKALTFGTHYCVVLPYQQAFQDIKKEHAKMAGIKLDTLLKSKSQKNINENVESLMECFDILSEDAKDEIKECLPKYINNVMSNIELCEGGQFVTDTLKYSSEELSEMSSILNEAKGKASANIGKTKTNSIIDGFISKQQPNVKINNSETLLNIYKNAAPDNVSGCIIKHLDIERVIPIKIDDISLGYYYVEDVGALKSLKDMSNDPMRALNRGIAQLNQKDPTQSNSELFFSRMSDMLVKALSSDKKFLQDNEKFKEEIYAVLKYGSLINKQLRVTFIPASQMIEFGLGDSMLKKSLFYAKLYLTMLITHIGMRINRGYDKRIYLVKQGVSKDIGSSVQRAIRDIKKDSKSLLMMSNVNNILNSAGSTHDIFIPVSSNGDKAIDYDVMSGQDVQIKDEIMEFLEEKMIDGTGIPMALMQASAEVDFAKSLVLLNSKFLKRTLSYQKLYQKPLNKFYNSIKKAEYFTNTGEEYVDVFVKYQAPTALGITTMIENIQNAKSLVDDLGSMYVSGDGEDDTAILSTFTRLLMRSFCPCVPWDNFDKLYEEAIATVKLNKPASGGDNSEDGM